MATIPYFAPLTWHLGPFTVGIFGVFMALGIWAASEILVSQARQSGLDVAPMRGFAPWGVGGGIVVGHLVHLFFYHPEELSKSPFQPFMLWDGLSSFGGLLGGILAAVLYFHRTGFSFRAYSDAFALAVAPGWAIARLGCFGVHDHPGVPSEFFLAVRFPGMSRHDLGLYDALVLFALTGVLFALRRRFKGGLLPLLGLLYGASRFGLDFLRATDLPYVDARYFGLTPAQFGCIGLMLYGLFELIRRAVSGGASSATPTPAQSR